MNDADDDVPNYPEWRYYPKASGRQQGWWTNRDEVIYCWSGPYGMEGCEGLLYSRRRNGPWSTQRFDPHDRHVFDLDTITMEGML